MSNPAVQELDALLLSLHALKPPGVSTSKVQAATKICMELQNIPVEPHFVDSLVNAFHKSPDTHKLGVLYIIDSIMRQWVVTGAAHAGGVRRMTDSLPMLMNTYIPNVPDSQKEKLVKLLGIWLDSKTFPAGMLADFKDRLLNPTVTHFQLTQPPSQPNIDPASLLAALSAPPPPSNQIPQASQQMHIPQPLPVAHSVAPPSSTPVNAVVNSAPSNPLLAALANLVPQPPQAIQSPASAHLHAPPPSVPLGLHNTITPLQNPSQPQPQPALAVPPPAAGNFAALAALFPNSHTGAQDPNAFMNQLQLLQSLSQSLGPDGLKTILQALGSQQSQQAARPGATFPMNAAHVTSSVNSYQTQPPQYNGRDQASRERSRSPDWDRRRYSPPNRRDSPTYGAYDANARTNPYRDQEERGRRGTRRGGTSTVSRTDYRQRSPQSFSRESPTPHNDGPKPIAYDNKLQDGRIKVLSRTLFVGGVKYVLCNDCFQPLYLLTNPRTNEPDLKNFFRQFGGVQSCIVNTDKRHAFLKLISHQDAMATRQAVFNLPESEYRSLFERVNWAVGFGPTHCADYNIGVSVIPLELLTDADRKWMLTAEYGGTGGQPIESGMVVEEPDIEIGTGPSSKAIHRRGGAHQQGRNNHSNHSSRRGGGGVATSSPDVSARHQNRGFNRSDAASYNQDVNTIGPPPVVPNFGAPIPGFPFAR